MLVKNVGTTDRMVRAVVGAGLMALSLRCGVASSRLPGVVLAAGGAALLFSAAAGSCTLYRPFGIDTSTQSTGDPS